MTMNVWTVESPRRAASLDALRAARLVESIGSERVNDFATEVLRVVETVAPIAQCTVFAYESGNRPRTFSIADHRGGRELGEISALYTRRFYGLDGNQVVLAARPGQAGPDGAGVVLHRQGRRDIGHEGYRLACYDRLRVTDRLALLVQPLDDVWLSLNLYRGFEHGAFHADELERIEALAPLLAHAARHRYRLGARDRDVSAQMLGRLRRLCPALTKRELDALKGVLQGLTADEIADRMGVRPASVVTYQKRAYRRLGISRQRELFALCLSADG
jgi:DNA-binding CsgD family transcriptional regulator